jgi:hypothetical protein
VSVVGAVNRAAGAAVRPAEADEFGACGLEADLQALNLVEPAVQAGSWMPSEWRAGGQASGRGVYGSGNTSPASAALARRARSTSMAQATMPDVDTPSIQTSFLV